MANIRQLRSPKGDIRVALTSGHVLRLTEELRDVPEIFWAKAYSLGAVSGEMVGSSLASKEEEEKMLAKKASEKFIVDLTEVLKGLFDNPKGAIDEKGNPLTRKVSAILGKPVKRPEMLKIWEELKKTEG